MNLAFAPASRHDGDAPSGHGVRPLRVVLLSETLLTGGAETFVLRLADSLRKVGVDTRIYVLRGEAVDGSLHASIAPGVTVAAGSVPLLKLLLKIDGLLYLCGSSFSLLRALQARSLRGYLRQARPDVVHSHLLSSDLVAAGACTGEGIPWISTMHGDYLAMEKTGRSRAARIPNFRRAIAHVEACVHHIVAITDPQLEQAARMLRKASVERRISKIYNGYGMVEAEQAQAGPDPLAQIPPGSFVIGMVARGVRQKGWAAVVSAFHTLADEDAWLVLVGDGEYIEEVRRGPSHPRVVFTGNVTKPLRYIRRFDVACLPTRFATESLPTVIIEYLVLGKPVIATDVGEIAQMIEAPGHGPAGVLLRLDTEQNMANELATALKGLRTNPDLRVELSARARRAAQKFDMDRCVSAYISVYSQVAASAHAAAASEEFQ